MSALRPVPGSLRATPLPIIAGPRLGGTPLPAGGVVTVSRASTATPTDPARTRQTSEPLLDPPFAFDQPPAAGAAEDVAPRAFFLDR